jgi:murein DD-endopeptidase MepM/ murein hydrolase activator NlpD
MRKICGACILAFLAFCLLFGASAGGADDSGIDVRLSREEARMRNLEKKIAEHQQRVRQMGAREEGVISRIDELDQKRMVTEQRIRVLELKREKTRQSISDLRNEIEHTERELSSMKHVLEERLVNIYKYGGVAEFNLLLSAATAHEALETTLLLNRIAQQDEAMINGMLAKKEHLSAAAAKLEQERHALAANAATLEQARRTYREEINNSNTFLQKVRNERALHEKAVKELQDSQREIQRTIMDLMRRKRENEVRPDRPPAQQYTYLPSGGQLAWPVQGEITSSFGMRVHPTFKTKMMHSGIDIRAPRGTPVQAGGPGEVIYAGWLRGYGQIIIIDHGNDLSSVYAHLASLSVSEGDGVKRGQIIGTVGSTGTTTGAHLHFEVRLNGEARDPMRYLGR